MKHGMKRIVMAIPPMTPRLSIPPYLFPQCPSPLCVHGKLQHLLISLFADDNLVVKAKKESRHRPSPSDGASFN
jgi:hypothetical protein